jgi:energy-coupling factor transporter ATP-binding protein EcfA2
MARSGSTDGRCWRCRRPSCAPTAPARRRSSSRTPRAHINPLRTVGDFLTEGLRLNQGLPERASQDRACELLGAVGVEHPEVRLSNYPHELSGGLLQRVMIAAALTAEPRLLLADEPTTALDTVTQAEVLAILTELRRRLGLAMLFITHDPELAAATCDRTAVLHAGSIVEVQRSADLHGRPLHPYTARLVGARLSMDAQPRQRRDPAPASPPPGPSCRSRTCARSSSRDVAGPRWSRWTTSPSASPSPPPPVRWRSSASPARGRRPSPACSLGWRRRPRDGSGSPGRSRRRDGRRQPSDAGGPRPSKPSSRTPTAPSTPGSASATASRGAPPPRRP